MDRIGLFIFTDRWLKRCIIAVEAIHQGVFLGLCEYEDLNKLTEIYYQKTFQYFDYNYNKSGLFDWEQNIINRYFKNCHNILVGSAGGGREVLALIRLGYVVDAFDCSKPMVHTCRDFLRDEGHKIIVVHAPPARLPAVITDLYDGFLIGWGGYTHIAGRVNRVRYLSEISKNLQPGSPLLLSFWVRLPRKHFYRWVWSVAHVVRKVRRSTFAVELGDTIGESNRRMYTHSFTESEIREELGEAGFIMRLFSEQPYGYAIGIKK